MPLKTGTVRLINGDCLEVLKTLPEASVDSLCTDPPAGIGFMGKGWDNPNTFPLRDRGPRLTGSGSNVTWDKSKKGRDAFIAFLSSAMSECLRILKPGAYGLVWALPRTSHWTATALEDVGFEIRDVIHHIFGTGFPKGSTCLKPAAENWILVRKPAKKGTPLNIDECRIACNGDKLDGGRVSSKSDGWDRPWKSDAEAVAACHQRGADALAKAEQLGRWPANLAMSHHPDCRSECHPDCPVRLLDEQSGNLKAGVAVRRNGGGGKPGGDKRTTGTFCGGIDEDVGFGDSGGASRFFYCSKASRRDRGEGNTHPTVKNTKLMEWLIKLVTVRGGVVLDPFMGSGSTLVAALRCGRGAIGIEREAEYFQIAQQRLREVGI